MLTGDQQALFYNHVDAFWKLTFLDSEISKVAKLETFLCP